ncbi:hypothetical protein Tco_1063064, partial [Tanacetum coccineum]
EKASTNVTHEEKIEERAEGQAGLDPGRGNKSTKDQAGSDPIESHATLAGPNPEPMHKDFYQTFYPNIHDYLKLRMDDHFLNDKPSEDDQGRSLSTPIVNLLASPTIITTTITLALPPPPLTQSLMDLDLFARVLALEKRNANLECVFMFQNRSTNNLASRRFTFEHCDLESRIDSHVRETIKEYVQMALRAPLLQSLEDLSEEEMKQMLHNRMFESGSYQSHSDHEMLYNTLELAMDYDHQNALHDELSKNGKDVVTTKMLHLLLQKTMIKIIILLHLRTQIEAKKKRQDSDASGSTLPPYKDSEQKHNSDPKDIDTAHLPKMEECHKLLTDKVDLVNPEGHQILPNVYKPLPLGGPPGQILSVISLKSYERYGYNYMREIVIRRADYKEYKISEADFKSMHPNDFKDMYMLHLQGKLNHLSKSDKIHLHTAINLWIKNLVIRKRVEDLQLGIESYQTKLNLELPNWVASDFLFKEDYTIVNKPRIVIYKDRNDQKKMMRISKVYKFSEGTLTRIQEKLDFIVKEYVLF